MRERNSRILRMIARARIPELLEPFGLSLNAGQVDRILTYVELLSKWNSKINLVGPASDEECIKRHFGESLFLRRWVELQGKLLDIGSGAGFPGLALKLISSNLGVTLLEPTAKKRAFLKEVTRACQFDHVTVLGTRLEEFAPTLHEPIFDFATSRAVGGFDQMIENAELCIKPKGRLCLWLGQDQAAHIRAIGSRLKWTGPKPIPFSRKRELWIGKL